MALGDIILAVAAWLIGYFGLSLAGTAVTVVMLSPLFTVELPLFPFEVTLSTVSPTLLFPLSTIGTVWASVVSVVWGATLMITILGGPIGTTTVGVIYTITLAAQYFICFFLTTGVVSGVAFLFVPLTLILGVVVMLVPMLLLVVGIPFSGIILSYALVFGVVITFVLMFVLMSAMFVPTLSLPVVSILGMVVMFIPMLMLLVLASPLTLPVTCILAILTALLGGGGGGGTIYGSTTYA